MLRTSVLGGACLLLAACANHQPTKQLAMGLPGFMDQSTAIEKQRPVLPTTHFVKWYSDDRFAGRIELDYISGMSQRDYLFEEPNQELFRPMVKAALEQSGLQARTAAAARYALQIDFHELDTDGFGRHFAGKTSATYRIVDRFSNEAVFQQTVQSNFLAEYPGLNEDDASFAYDVSAPGVIRATQAFGAFSLYEAGFVEVWNNNGKLRDFFGGDTISEVSQASWDDTYQAYAWTTGISVVSGPALVLIGQLDPTNYVSLQLEGRSEQQIGTDARYGNLSKAGLASRSARKRAAQLNTHLLAQSLTVFLMDFAQHEGVPLTQLVACNAADAAASDVIEALRSGQRTISDDCVRYKKPKFSRGVAITKYK